MQWLERGALLMLLPAVRFRTPFGAGFSDKLFRCCVPRQGTVPSHASLDPGVNEYLV